MELFGQEYSVLQLVVFCFCAFTAGFSKSGIIGLGIVITPLMASVLPAGASLGFLLPLYVMGDLSAIIILNRKVMWKPLLRALPWGVFGTLIGWLIAGAINLRFGPSADVFLRKLIGFVMGVVVLLSYYVSRHPELAMGGARTPSGRFAPTAGAADVKRWYAALLGTFGGLSSMLTNSGGPVWALYFSSLRMEVKEVVSAGVWCFFISTLIKLPLSANLGFLTASSAKLNFLLLPLTIAGVLVGTRVSGRYSRETFGRIIQVLAACGAIYMIVT